MIFLSILLKRSPRFRKVKWLAQSHSSTKWLSWDLIPSLAVTQACALIYCSELLLPSAGSVLMAIFLGLCNFKRLGQRT